MLEVVAHFVLETVGGLTGHVVLWAVTLGRWRAFESTSDAITLVGLLFWIATGLVSLGPGYGNGLALMEEGGAAGIGPQTVIAGALADLVIGSESRSGARRGPRSIARSASRSCTSCSAPGSCRACGAIRSGPCSR